MSAKSKIKCSKEFSFHEESSRRDTYLGGFCAISGRKFRQPTWVKGKKLVSDSEENCHIYNVKQITFKDSSDSEIIGHCVRALNIHEERYSVTIWINDKGKVIDAHCGCLSGKSYCKHVAALYYYTNQERPETKTDKPCQWKSHSAKVNSIYKKPRTFQEMFGGNFESDYSAPDDETTQELKDLLEECNLQDSSFYKDLTVDVNKVDTPTVLPQLDDDICAMFEQDLPNNDIFVTFRKINDLIEKLAPDVKLYYQNNLVADVDQCTHIFLSTLSQSLCKEVFCYIFIS